MLSNSPQNTANQIIDLYLQYGNSAYAGEPVTQSSHMLQAAQLAKAAGYDDEVILAAFLHDIGHICASREAAQMGQLGTLDHEAIGAQFLQQCGCKDRLIRLVQNHVQAKRYLTFIHPDYYHALSDASKQTLVYQGGIMTATEAAVFEQDELFPLYILMRQWDDQAKATDVSLISFTYLRDSLVTYLSH